MPATGGGPAPGAYGGGRRRRRRTPPAPSSINAILGGRGVAQVERQTRRRPRFRYQPAPSARPLGGRDVRGVERQRRHQETIAAASYAASRRRAPRLETPEILRPRVARPGVRLPPKPKTPKAPKVEARKSIRRGLAPGAGKRFLNRARARELLQDWERIEPKPKRFEKRVQVKGARPGTKRIVVTKKISPKQRRRRGKLRRTVAHEVVREFEQMGHPELAPQWAGKIEARRELNRRVRQIVKRNPPRVERKKLRKLERRLRAVNPPGQPKATERRPGRVQYTPSDTDAWRGRLEARGIHVPKKSTGTQIAEIAANVGLVVLPGGGLARATREVTTGGATIRAAARGLGAVRFGAAAGRAVPRAVRGISRPSRRSANFEVRCAGHGSKVEADCERGQRQPRSRPRHSEYASAPAPARACARRDCRGQS